MYKFTEMRFKKRLFSKEALEPFIRERKYQTNLYTTHLRIMHDISRRYLYKFQDKERKKWKLLVSILSSVRQKRGGVKVFRSLAETMSRREGCEGLEITRGKGRSVVLCPLSAEFYSECVLYPFIDSIRQSISLTSAIIA